MDLKLVDCTLRDGGYYNNWDFPIRLVQDYLDAMAAASVDYVELGFRSLDTAGFKGPCAYTTDSFLNSLDLPQGVKVGVMVNASELLDRATPPIDLARRLFRRAQDSPAQLVRLACHWREIEAALPVAAWLKSSGYEVAVNLMQVADRSLETLEHLGVLLGQTSIDALYFADSLGSLGPSRIAAIVRALRTSWQGALGIHAHDNMGRALENTLQALDEGVTWLDSTVTGMGRGPGNTRTEYLLLELESRTGRKRNIAPLLSLIPRHFQALHTRHRWGSNPYYYIAGQHGIHPTFVQEMLSDPRYGETEILAALDHLRETGAKKFSREVLDAGLHGYGGELSGTWEASNTISNREVLILGSGPSAKGHEAALERFIQSQKPFVLALNTQESVDPRLIDARAACHPFRLLADSTAYRSLSQPLIIPGTRLPDFVRTVLDGVRWLDFGLKVEPGVFEFGTTSAVAPRLLVVAYALAIATSGRATRIFLAGFDGYATDDPRTTEMDELFELYQASAGSVPIVSLTPTRYKIPITSLYSF